MNSVRIRGAACAAGLMICMPALAQPGPMRAPVLPQAIEMHMQQTRTLEQREAIEAQKRGSLPVPDSASGKVQESPKPSAARKSRKTARHSVPAAGAATGNAGSRGASAMPGG